MQDGLIQCIKVPLAGPNEQSPRLAGEQEWASPGNKHSRERAQDVQLASHPINTSFSLLTRVEKSLGSPKAGVPLTYRSTGPQVLAELRNFTHQCSVGF